MIQDTEVIFLDAAGTLFELAEPVGVTYARISRQHGLTVEPAALDHAFRCSWKELPAPVHPEGHPPADDDRSWWYELVDHSFEKVLGERLAPEVLQPLFTELYDHFAQAHAWSLFPDVLPALDALRGKVRFLAVSNFDGRLRPILSGLGLAPYFEKVIVSSEVGASKPHRRVFDAARQAANVAPERCLHIGDEEKADLLGAQAAGIPAMLVKRPEVTLLTIAELVLAKQAK